MGQPKSRRMLSNSVQAVLTGDNLGIKFWPYALYHDIRLSNSFSESNTITAHIEKSTSNQYNLSLLWTLGYFVYVRPPGKIKAKLKNISPKESSLGMIHITPKLCSTILLILTESSQIPMFYLTIARINSVP